MGAFLTALAFGVAGGVILNVMPCVFPVLFMKVQHWIAGTGVTSRARRVESLGYLFGSVAAFTGFAIFIIALRAAGRGLGWGMQMQNPVFVAIVVAMLFVLALETVGVFTFRFSLNGGRSTGGWKSAFLDGLVITLVSTPCSAPFLGGAAAFALAQDTAWWQTLAIFWSVGLGLSLPVLALGFIPALNRLLPRPGAWMDTFKYLVGFTLFGACVWFFGSLQKQVSAEAANNFLWFLLALAAGLWAKEHLLPVGASPRRAAVHNLLLAGAVAGAGYGFVDLEKQAPAVAAVAVVASEGAEVPVSVQDGKLVWTPFTEAAKEAALKRNQPIFVDFTADWCASCKTFERTHIDTAGVREALSETRVLAMKADLTADESLWDVLARLGRNGLPTYAIYLPDGSHELLPEGPPVSLVERLREAAKRFPPEKMRNL